MAYKLYLKSEKENMKPNNELLKKELLKEISTSKMTFERKITVMKLLDQAFREYMGVIYLSDEELEEKDMLNRSM